MTTNERLNWNRYSYVRSATQSSTHSPSFFRNFVDFFEIKCLNPDKTDWMRTCAPPVPHHHNHGSVDLAQADTDTHLLIDNRDNYQYV